MVSSEIAIVASRGLAMRTKSRVRSAKGAVEPCRVEQNETLGCGVH